MPVTASRLFNFIEKRPSFTIERHEVSSAAFSDLRRSLRLMIVSFHESGDWEAKEIAGRLRSVLSKWLTVPVRFDNGLLLALEEMGGAKAVESRWGRDICDHYDIACRTAQELTEIENPVRATLVKIIKGLQDNGQSFRIFCHRQSREHFESLSNSFVIEDLPHDAFIHTVVEYREAELFDALLKIGPLRSRGWGAVPDALLTAPRFDTLVQVVWSGCNDEPDFGYDPVSVQLPDDNSRAGVDPVTDRHNPILQLSWKVRETRSRDNTVGRHSDLPDIDELDVFTKLSQPVDMQNATMLQLGEAHGILYQPRSQVLSLDGDLLLDGDSQAINYRLPNETLYEGMSLILPVLNDESLDELHVEEGYFSRIWKDKLQAEYQNNPMDLVNRLRANGLLLLGLRSGIERWCVPATTVIPAPQQVLHFQILMNVLGIDFDDGVSANRRRAAWWQYAWDEIRRSRGEAIQRGTQEQQIRRSQVLNIVRSLDAEIRNKLENSTFPFSIPISENQEYRGVFLFFSIHAIEEGFRVPPNELKKICELDRIDQWRA